MPEVLGALKEQNHQDGMRHTSGRVASASRMRSVMSSSEASPSPEPAPWSSAIGHAGTGKSGRVIERLQGDIDRQRREKQLLQTRYEEVQKANELLVSRNQSLQDRNSNYEQSHEANLRQLARKERQVEELREELRKEKLKSARAEEQAEAAASSEEHWRKEASQAKAYAAQKETEYETIVACRKMDHDRHQSGLDKIRCGFDSLLRRQEDDLEKQRKLEIIAEQQRQTIAQLEELTKKLTTNFRAYKHEIDTCLSQLRDTARNNDQAIDQKLDELTGVTGRMRWVMNLDSMVNYSGNVGLPVADSQRMLANPASGTNGWHTGPRERSLSPSKGNRLTKHRRKDSVKVPK
ncbi:hypothetical protein ABEF95_017112 [Exophiala dermatitidis]